jgi:predicted Holliday junction resolvase-like endonuclease
MYVYDGAMMNQWGPALLVVLSILLTVLYNNKRLDDLRSEVNVRIDDLQRNFNARFDDLQAEINRRFDDVNRRLDSLEKRVMKIEERLERPIIPAR